MSAGGGKLIAADKSAVLAKPLFDAVAVGDDQYRGRLANPVSTDWSDWGEVFCQSDDLLDQFVTSR